MTTRAGHILILHPDDLLVIKRALQFLHTTEPDNPKVDAATQRVIRQGAEAYTDRELHYGCIYLGAVYARQFGTEFH